jgi:hypothetical protein
VELGVRHRPRVAGSQSGAHPAVVFDAFRELRRIHAELDGRQERAPSPTEPPHPAAA